MKKLISFVLGIIICLSTVMFVTSCSGGDGKSGCKNCGRSPVYALGYCKSCYKSFMDYTYGD